MVNEGWQPKGALVLGHGLVFGTGSPRAQACLPRLEQEADLNDVKLVRRALVKTMQLLLRKHSLRPPHLLPVIKNRYSSRRWSKMLDCSLTRSLRCQRMLMLSTFK